MPNQPIGTLQVSLPPSLSLLCEWYCQMHTLSASHDISLNLHQGAAVDMLEILETSRRPQHLSSSTSLAPRPEEQDADFSKKKK